MDSGTENINTSAGSTLIFAAPYAANPRQFWYIALNYSSATRTLDDPLCERVR